MMVNNPQNYWNFGLFSSSSIPENRKYDVLETGSVIREETTLATEVYTHTGCYLNFNSHHLLHVKTGLIQSLHNRASTICKESQDLVKEISSLRSYL
jgi:hypothetical protein